MDVAAAGHWSGPFSVEPADLAAAATRASDRLALAALLALPAAMGLAIWLDERAKHRHRETDGREPHRVEEPPEIH